MSWRGQHFGLGECIARKVDMTAIWIACVWLIAANFAAIIPSSDNHWGRAYVLMATSVPLVILLGWTQGWMASMIFLVCAASILRWPLMLMWRWSVKTLQKRQK